MIRSEYLNIAKLTADERVLRLFDVVAQHGGVLRFVGGAVRDALRGIKSYDLNLATDLSPEELVEACNEEGFDTMPMGIKQNSVGVRLDGNVVEISSLHKFVSNLEGGIDVEYTDNWEEDASRRDLTINAVYADEKGNVFDYYNGIDDLERGFVRFIGSAAQKIQEDPVRILRYFRFYAMYGLEEPNRKAVEACRENAELLKKVPMEKISDELLKILHTYHAPRAFRLMQANGVLGYIMPDAEYIENLEFFNQFAQGQQFDDAEILRLFVLYRPDAVWAENLAVRLKFTKSQKALLMNLAKMQCNKEDFLSAVGRAGLVYRYGRDVCKAKWLAEVAFNKRWPDNVWEVYASIAETPKPEFPVSGKDIMQFGMAESRQIGAVMRELEKRWVESGFNMSRDQLLEQFKQVI
ncbi:MAG: CCA tRNA nucleotidyltransferase [Alphaproteobacteria bacterium]|nr:CCA tRNA nucleotidyltransferase [Alphaproteobacteria bacterium]